MATHDMVIRGGLVVDGSGAPAREADVALRDGRVVAVGKHVLRGAREIDARGKIVTPGFVDVHTHYDAQATWDPYLTPSSQHGVTTAVMGNCGVGFAPAANNDERHAWLIGLMEGVEDIPGAALTEGMKWGFESFAEYLDVLERMPRVLDLGTQMPHGALRAYVMGDRGARNDAPTVNDVHEMRRLTLDALRAGALGFSTSRTPLHKASDGELVPGTYAERDELFAIADALRVAGHGVFQAAVEHTALPEELPWLTEIAQRTGRTVSVNLSQIDARPDLWRDVLARIDAAQASGADVVAQVAGRAIGIIMGLELTAHPLLSTPTYLEMFHEPHAVRVALLRDPSVRARLLADAPLDLGAFENLVTRSFDKMFPAHGGRIDYEPKAEDSVAAIAARSGKSARQVALDALLEDGGRGKMYFPLFNYADGNLDVLHELHRHPHTRMGLSDAGAHCGAICDGGMPTFMLTHWARDRRGHRLALEHVVRRQTSETARMFGLHDRGVLAPGMRADVNVIDLDALAVGPVEVVHDLPAGGRRLLQRAKGYAYTLCAGVVTVERDELTGALPGRLVRGPQASPARTARALHCAA